eukprot:SAG31_NODE_84_length_27014_cov_3.743006_16_plen_91_part_00
MKNSFGEETPVLESFVLQDGKEYIARHETIEQTHETEAFAMLDEQDMESAAICIQRRCATPKSHTFARARAKCTVWTGGEDIHRGCDMVR